MSEKTSVDDIIGLIKTDEPTNSVEEVRKLRGRETECERLKKENEQLKSKLFDIELELEHSKESNDDAHYELTQIKKENDDLKRGILKDIFADECEEYKKENEQLKSALKELREIGDYQAHRIEEQNEEIKDYQDTLARTEEQLRNLRKLANELYMEGSE